MSIKGILFGISLLLGFIAGQLFAIISILNDISDKVP